MHVLMHHDIIWWGAAGGAVLAWLGVYRKLVRPAMRRALASIKRAGQMADDYFGDKEKGKPSLPDEVRALSNDVRRMREHRHGADGMPQWPSVPESNGPRPASRPADRR